ncbi:hypothetical protein AtubIFM57258_010103 [Aspergillus tubingensis]|nr:hypothetical protein AtubIFM57258_010103 [Aspergillus tubingensis]
MFSTLSRVAPAPSRSILQHASPQIPKVAVLTGASRALSSTPPSQKEVTLLQDKKNGFGFARSNPRPPKPRTKGVTEIRGPYYTVCDITAQRGESARPKAES